MIKNSQSLHEEVLRNGGVGIMATDTLYGLVGLALDPSAVERIYQLKRRHPSKPLIILIGSQADLKLFGINPDGQQKKSLNTYWPGPVSIILPCHRHDFEYLHRGTNTLAFRLPDKPALQRLLARTGPLVAPSANPESEPPAASLGQAKGYFGAEVDFYKSGQTKSKPSKLIKIDGQQVTVLRG
jgi:L-threonylcarbamoyladenylate synthase